MTVRWHDLDVVHGFHSWVCHWMSIEPLRSVCPVDDRDGCHASATFAEGHGTHRSLHPSELDFLHPLAASFRSVSAAAHPRPPSRCLKPQLLPQLQLMSLPSSSTLSLLCRSYPSSGRMLIQCNARQYTYRTVDRVNVVRSVPELSLLPAVLWEERQQRHMDANGVLPGRCQGCAEPVGCRCHHTAMLRTNNLARTGNTCLSFSKSFRAAAVVTLWQRAKTTTDRKPSHTNHTHQCVVEKATMRTAYPRTSTSQTNVGISTNIGISISINININAKNGHRK